MDSSGIINEAKCYRLVPGVLQPSSSSQPNFAGPSAIIQWAGNMHMIWKKAFILKIIEVGVWNSQSNPNQGHFRALIVITINEFREKAHPKSGMGFTNNAYLTIKI